MAPINATPIKVYVLLFLIVIIGYAVFIISRSLKKSNKDMEHFVEENPNYKFRLEVMKVFDMYMSRNPTPEEIEKYASIANEQDILLAILKDFNITVSDVKKETAVVVEEEAEPFVDEEAPEEDAVAKNNLDIQKLVSDAKGSLGIVDTWTQKDDGSDMVSVSRQSYNDIKAKVDELQSAVAALVTKTGASQ